LEINIFNIYGLKKVCREHYKCLHDDTADDCKQKSVHVVLAVNARASAYCLDVITFALSSLTVVLSHGTKSECVKAVNMQTLQIPRGAVSPI